MTPNIIALIVAAIGGLIVLALQESIKEIIKKLFSGLNSKQVTVIFIALIGFAFGLIYLTGSRVLNNKSAAIETDSTVSNNPSDAQVYADLAKTGLDEVKELSEKKQFKDSVRAATREKQWVYQIGIPKENKSEAWETAKTLNSIPNICVFRESRKNYLIICDRNYSKKTMEDSLKVFSSIVNLISAENRVKIVDIISYCPKRKKLIETDKITRRKQPESFKCLTCE
jgi:hypothetical protein